MASGTIYGSTGNQYIDSKIEWTSTANNSANTSSVTAKLYYKRNNTGFTTSGTGTFTISIDGVQSSESKTLNITENAWVLAVSGTATVNHKDDGTKSIVINASGSIPSTTLSSTSCSGSVKLDTIPRASTISSLPNKQLDTNCEIKWTPKSATFRYKVKIASGSWSYTSETIHPNKTSQYTYTYKLPLDIANQMPIDSKLVNVGVTLTTYSDSNATKVVGYDTENFLAVLPDNELTKPSVLMSLTPDGSSLSSKFSGLYIQGKSKVKATISGITGKYNATIKSHEVILLGKSYSKNLGDNPSPSSFVSDFLSTSGTVTVVGKAKDSRGLYGEETQNITVIPYNKPKLLPGSGESAIVCARCDSAGNLSESGTYLRIKAGRSYSKVMSGSTQKNFCALQYRYKTENASTYSSYVTLLGKDDISTDYVDIVLGNIVSSISTSYTVQISVIDDIGESTTVTYTIPTDKVTFHLGEDIDGAAFGKYAERDKALDIAPDWDIYYKGNHIENKFYSLLGNTKIPSGSDLNDYKTPDVYAIETDTNATNIANMPPIKKAGLVLVYAATGNDDISNGTWKYLIQEYKSLYTEIPIYRRLINSNANGDWSYGIWRMEKGFDTGWVELTMSSKASAPTTVAREGAGCFYRVINENHVYVRFNCAFSFGGSSVNLNSTPIPQGYRPKNNAYALAPVNDRAIARASVASDGYIYVNYVQNMASASTTTSFEATWIDGYIDYWL